MWVPDAVGLNGSGKSNLLTAIEFLTVESSALKLGRKQYLHEGASSAVLSASVELVLDNTDRTLVAFQRDEVRLSRRITCNKDEYVLDSKSVSSTEFLAVLESCGFSKSNPYYVVRQGQIANMTTMADDARLRLLKEIAGTRSYDCKREEAIKTLEDTKRKCATVSQTLGAIQERMDLLQEQQQELLDFRQLDLKQRCLAAVRHGKTVDQARSALSTASVGLDAARVSLSDVRLRLEEERTEADELKERRESSRKEVEDAVRVLESAKQQENIARGQVKALQIELSHRRESAARQQQTQMDAIKEIQVLTNTVENLEAEKENDAPRTSGLEREAAESEARVESLVQESGHISTKMARNQGFRTVAERNRVLEKKVKEWESLVKSEEQEKKQCDKDKAATRQQIHSLEARILEADRELKQTTDTFSLLKQENNDASVELRDLIRQLDELERKVQHSRSDRGKKEEEVSVCQRAADKTLSGPNMRALRVVDTVVCREKLQKAVFGTLAEVITVEPGLETAVEVVGGSQMSNLVVSDYHVARKLTDEVSKSGVGRLTVAPLAQLRDRRREVRQPQRGRLLMDFIRCADEVRPAVEQVFGSYVVVESLDEGRELRHQGFNTITVDGDSVDKRGILSGGYRAASDVICKHAAVSRAREEFRQSDDLVQRLKSSLEQTKAAVHKAEIHSGDVLKRKNEAGSRHDKVVSLLSMLRSEFDSAKLRLTTLGVTSMHLECEIAGHQNEIQVLRRECLSTALNELSEAEMVRLDQITSELPQLQKLHRKLSKDIMKLKQSYEARDVRILNAKDTIVELQETIRDTEVDVLVSAAEDLERDFQARQAELESFQLSRKEAAKAVGNAKRKAHESTSRLKDLDESISELSLELAAEQTRCHKIEADVESETARVENLRLAEVPLPGDDEVASLVDEYRRLTLPQLARVTADLNKLVDNFSGINQKAVDQYSAFAHQLKDLHQRRTKLQESEAAIVDLMDTLDNKKDAVLMKTFENVNRQFGLAFKKIVPAGEACMVLKRMTDEELEHWRRCRLEDSERRVTRAEDSLDTLQLESQPYESKVDLYTGITMKLSFNSAVHGLTPLRQLSGGQRTVAAVALIFGLQRCDPGPFYLFDEIDAALDERYRTAVAKLINEGAESAQCILTTFSRELLLPGATFYHVSMHNKCSLIREVTELEAEEVVQHKPLAVEM
ncbi:MAG: uncharacterized protein KVP18_004146 [Porospora cf. gigantea A]|uniref:uncharacterized protein n=1 Tax=Porospora cf. gigantea A TaxID=2853593 RepID=UPI003559BB5B|nr:MAG: hypothetical protein KVP18_004146 [Porospora cf. gigantea A]